jgi:hypothetical protein
MVMYIQLEGGLRLSEIGSVTNLSGGHAGQSKNTSNDDDTALCKAWHLVIRYATRQRMEHRRPARSGCP